MPESEAIEHAYISKTRYHTVKKRLLESFDLGRKSAPNFIAMPRGLSIDTIRREKSELAAMLRIARRLHSVRRRSLFQGATSVNFPRSQILN